MNKQNKLRLGYSDRTLNIILTVSFVLFNAIIIYPLIFVLSSSFSSGSAVTAGKVLLWPVNPTVYGYKLVFQNQTVWTGFRNTIYYTGVGTAINMILTILCAYPLSRKNMQGRGFYILFFTIPMFFGGGLIPNYILMTDLHLNNTGWAVMLSGALSIYNMILMRTYFQISIPQELHEAARVDGISDIGYLLRIVLPLSKAILAVICLYYLVGHWNSYFTEMIYLRKREKYPLQLILRSILESSKVDANTLTGVDGETLANMIGAADLLKYSLVVVASVPILCVYPFIQKYFEKGIMIGSVKG